MERIKSIVPRDRSAEERSRQKWNNVAKPLHSFGLLEECVVKMSGIFGSENFDINKRCVVLMCADNGVVEERVTQSDSSVTAVVAEAAANGEAAPPAETPPAEQPAPAPEAPPAETPPAQ